MLDRIIIGFGVGMSLVWFGLEPIYLLLVDIIVIVFAYWLRLPSHDLDHSSIAELQTAGEIAWGSLLYSVIFIVGLLIWPQTNHSLQAIFPMALMVLMALGLVFVYVVVIGFLTICAKMEAWRTRK